jgi:hypothetical protein
MAKRKLTLTVDAEVVERAHRYSEAHDTSISQLVTDYLGALGRASATGAEVYTPTVQRLLGVVPASVTLDDYRRHLDAKYGAEDGGAGE